MMKYVLTGNEMKIVDNYTSEVIGIPALVLMERAALAVYEEIVKACNESSRILVVCGCGNNGADGVAISRLLKEKNISVDVLLTGDREKYTESLKKQILIADNLHIKFVNEACFEEYNLIVDSIFGVGLSRKVEGEYADIIDKINNAQCDVISVDIPSGINSDNGNVMGCAVKAGITVTFGTYKIGNILYPGAEYTGKLILKNVGFPDEAFESISPNCSLIQKSDVINLLPKRKNYSNKGSYGKLIVAAGSVNMSGAACLCAESAYRTGTGLVKVFTSNENRVIIQSVLPEAVVLTYDDKHMNEEELELELSKSTCIACGPGIGNSQSAKKIVKCVLKSGKKAVLDADALNVISEHEELRELFHHNIIITPHVGEFARLTGLTIEHIKDNSITECSKYAMKYEITCVLKDARTIIAASDGRVWINTSGNNGMSTAGSGDVLTGIISSLVCQNVDMVNAAALGTYIHGLAGDAAAAVNGEYAVMAHDITDEISLVMHGNE